MEFNVEFKPIDHPLEPLDEDRPVKCPLQNSSVLNVSLSSLDYLCLFLLISMYVSVILGLLLWRFECDIWCGFCLKLDCHYFELHFQSPILFNGCTWNVLQLFYLGKSSCVKTNPWKLLKGMWITFQNYSWRGFLFANYCHISRLNTILIVVEVLPLY